MGGGEVCRWWGWTGSLADTQSGSWCAGGRWVWGRAPLALPSLLSPVASLRSADLHVPPGLQEPQGLTPPQLLVPASPCLLSSSSGSAQPPHPQLLGGESVSHPRAPLPPLASESTKPMEDPPSESPVLSRLASRLEKVKYIQIHGSHLHQTRLPATPGPIPARRSP